MMNQERKKALPKYILDFSVDDEEIRNFDFDNLTLEPPKAAGVNGAQMCELRYVKDSVVYSLYINQVVDISSGINCFDKGQLAMEADFKFDDPSYDHQNLRLYGGIVQMPPMSLPGSDEPHIGFYKKLRIKVIDLLKAKNYFSKHTFSQETNAPIDSLKIEERKRLFTPPLALPPTEEEIARDTTLGTKNRTVRKYFRMGFKDKFGRCSMFDNSSVEAADSHELFGKIFQRLGNELSDKREVKMSEIIGKGLKSVSLLSKIVGVVSVSTLSLKEYLTDITFVEYCDVVTKSQSAPLAKGLNVNITQKQREDQAIIAHTNKLNLMRVETGKSDQGVGGNNMMQGTMNNMSQMGQQAMPMGQMGQMGQQGITPMGQMGMNQMNTTAQQGMNPMGMGQNMQVQQWQAQQTLANGNPLDTAAAMMSSQYGD